MCLSWLHRVEWQKGDGLNACIRTGSNKNQHQAAHTHTHTSAPRKKKIWILQVYVMNSVKLAKPKRTVSRFYVDRAGKFPFFRLPSHLHFGVSFPFSRAVLNKPAQKFSTSQFDGRYFVFR